MVAKDKQKVIELGGLHVIGTERHEARRIDNQLRGRAAGKVICLVAFMCHTR